jgi:lipoprotein
MRSSFIYKVLMLLSLSLISCKSDDGGEALKEQMDKPIESVAKIPEGRYDAKVLAKLYMDQELAMNAALVRRLEDAANNAFEKQLSTFEDEELGFFKDLGNMFAYILRSDKSLKEEWKLKQGKYFSELSAKSEYPILMKEHAKDVNLLRQQFASNMNSIVAADASSQQVHVPNIDLSGMVEHARNNVAFELVENALEFFGIVAVLGSLLALIFGKKGGVIVAAILVLLLGAIASWWNDRRVLNGLREQYSHKNVSYDSLRESLDDQTVKTYQPWLK